MIGILGGMGPLATADFLRKLVEATPAERDQDHVPVLVYSVPQIPERVPAILGHGESPLPAMSAGVEILTRGGAQCIAIACNTAYHWFDALAAACPVPILHIADAAIAELGDARRVGIVATAGTLHSGFYQQRLAAAGCEILLPDATDERELILPGIRLVKEAKLREAGKLFRQAITDLQARGAERVILACTEVPVGLASVAPPPGRYAVDATDALARACVAWWQATTQQRSRA
jgi:aspartate racemase